MAQGSGARAPMFVLLAFSLGLAACSAVPLPANLNPASATRAETPLMAAVSGGHIDDVRSLTESGAALNTLTESGTPLAEAVRRGEERIAWYLLSQGAAPDLAVAGQPTPLMVAAEAGAGRLVRLLLSAGANVNAVSADGGTPVILAARNGHLSVVKALLSAGANVNVSQGGQSLLMMVVGGGDLLTAEMLLAAGAEVNYRSPDGQTALDVARARHNPDLEMLLVQAGAEL